MTALAGSLSDSELFAMSDAELMSPPASNPAESTWVAQLPEMEWRIIANGKNRTAELVFQQEPPMWARQTLTDFIELLDLPEGWDGYGASKVEEATVRQAIGLLFYSSDLLTPRPAVVPTTSGGVQFEWHGARDIEVEVRPDGSVGFLAAEDERDFESASQALPVIRTQVHDAFR